MCPLNRARYEIRNIFSGIVICGFEMMQLFWLLVPNSSQDIYIYTYYIYKIPSGRVGRTVRNLTEAISIFCQSPRIFNSTLCLMFFSSQSLQSPMGLELALSNNIILHTSLRSLLTPHPDPYTTSLQEKPVVAKTK